MASESGGRDGSGAPGREQDPRDKRIEELQRENAKLIDDLDRTTRDLDRTTRDRDRWERRSEDLKKQLDEARRAGKRQAAPFAKDQPQGSGKQPGRRSGAQYGRQWSRRCPPKVDETHRAPTACPDCGGAVEVTRVAPQHQEELPPVRPIVRRFDIEVGRCSQCRRRVQGRHRLQTSDALGATAVQFGPGLRLARRRVAHGDGRAAGQGRRPAADEVRPAGHRWRHDRCPFKPISSSCRPAKRVHRLFPLQGVANRFSRRRELVRRGCHSTSGVRVRRGVSFQRSS